MQQRIGPIEILNMTKDSDVVLVTYNSWQDNASVSDFISNLSSNANLRHITHSSLQIGLDTVKKYLDNIGKNFDFIISIGGGSVIDLAKILRATDIVDDQSKKLIDYSSKITHIAIPTTVGSGSEATTFATYYGNQKESFTKPANLPKYYCHEPSFLKSLGKDALYSSVLDGVTQAVESIFSKDANEESILLSLESIKGYIDSSIFTGPDFNIEKLQDAAHKAGKAINIAKTNIAHAISYHLTEHHQIPHGFAVFLSLPGLIKLIEKSSFASRSIQLKLKMLLETFNVENVNELLERFYYIQSIIKHSHLNKVTTQDQFRKYLNIAKSSSRGKNLSIDLQTYNEKEIIELFYD